MPAPPTTKSKPDLERALGAEGEKEYRRLLRALRRARGSFFLFPIESDFPNALRDALLERLCADLAAEGSCLRVAAVNRREWNVFALPVLETPVTESDVVVLVGLEDTPGIVPEIGVQPVRPPALALLNQQRESLHQHVPAPFLVWCPPYVFTTLMEQAPDFFAHYASLFHFYNAAPERRQIDLLPTLANATIVPAIITSSAAARIAVTFYEEKVAKHVEPTPERARALLGLANALLELYGLDYTQHVQRTMQVVAEALALLSPELDPYQWARGQGILGLAYDKLSTGNRTQNIKQAIACYEKSLQIYTKNDFPQEWATTQNNLGNAYAQLPDGDQAQNLQLAVVCYNAALEVYSESKFPYTWAMTQNNLGNVYGELTTGNQEQNLQQAIQCYEAALRVYTESDFPQDWAMAQNNLGTAYGDLLTGDQTQNLQQAIACYQSALRVYTEAGFPYEWARTKYNLGVTYMDLPTSDRTQNLLHVLDCYKAALRVYTKADSPHLWGNTQFNLALALEELGNLEAAQKTMRCALDGYRQVGLETEVERAENLLRQWEDA